MTTKNPITFLQSQIRINAMAIENIKRENRRNGNEEDFLKIAPAIGILETENDQCKEAIKILSEIKPEWIKQA